MKTSKKILIITVSLLITTFISASIAGGLCFLWNWSFWPVFWMLSGTQILGSLWYDKYYESSKLLKSVEEYTNKPYKKYIVPLNCAHCGNVVEVETDLNYTEFKCENCKKYNGLHVNFMAAAITEPINQA
jgi:phage FluMu protein Com